MRPAVSGGEFVTGETPGGHLFAEAGGHALVMGEEVEEPGGVVDVGLPEGGALIVGGFGVRPACADVVRRDRAAIVDVGFVVWQRADDKNIVHARLTTV